MAAIKSYTDLSQSKILSRILSDETADMWYWHFPTAPTYNNYGYPMFHKGEDITNIPCWSLSALLNVLPKIEHLKPFIDLSPELDSDKVAIYYHSEDSPYIVRDNLIDACYEMILKLHELNLL